LEKKDQQRGKKTREKGGDDAHKGKTANSTRGGGEKKTKIKTKKGFCEKSNLTKKGRRLPGEKSLGSGGEQCSPKGRGVAKEGQVSEIAVVKKERKSLGNQTLESRPGNRKKTKKKAQRSEYCIYPWPAS